MSPIHFSFHQGEAFMRRNVCEMCLLCFSTTFSRRLVSCTETDFSPFPHLGHEQSLAEVSACHGVLCKDNVFYFVFYFCIMNVHNYAPERYLRVGGWMSTLCFCIGLSLKSLASRRLDLHKEHGKLHINYKFIILLDAEDAPLTLGPVPEWEFPNKMGLRKPFCADFFFF